jgi:hypothetical protein
VLRARALKAGCRCGGTDRDMLDVQAVESETEYIRLGSGAQKEYRPAATATRMPASWAIKMPWLLLSILS